MCCIFYRCFALEDLVVKRIDGKVEVLNAIKSIFESCDTLEFNAKNIYQVNQTTVIAFTLKLDDIILTGSDIIEWENNFMKELRAYMNIPKG
jgi:hypothetical protein